MEVLVIGLATSFNFIVIMWKFTHNRVLDASIDFGVFVAISAMFAGTIAGMSVGMVASAIVSIYLLINPPTLPVLDSSEWKDRFQRPG